MAESRGALRRFWLNVHLWIGVGLAILIVPIAISGAILTVQDELEAVLHPKRYAVSGPAVALTPSDYLKAAQAALPAGASATALRFPSEAGGPVIVDSRGRGIRFDVYLDPPTGRVLEAVNSGDSFFRFLHVLHGNLSVPEYSGRTIVGWVGVAMLISSLTGIYLWWPRNGSFIPGLRWRRSSSTNNNLHHMLGFWISLPLAAVSATGIYLGFPQQGRDVLSSITPMSPRPNFGQPARQPALTPEKAIDIALASQSGARPAVLFVATAAQGGPPVWRVQLRNPGSPDVATVLVDDRSATVSPMPVLKGDSVARWIRWIHEGSHSGRVWQAIVFLTGVFPPIFVVTGIIMWLRRRSAKPARRGGARLHPAE